VDSTVPGFPQNPYPIAGILQFAASLIRMLGINLTRGGSEEVTTADDGSYGIDPANMDNGYDEGDVIRIQSGSWYRDIFIDTTNNPDGEDVNLNKPVDIGIVTGKGVSLPRGIICGSTQRR